jgi:hypothetical protein
MTFSSEQGHCVGNYKDGTKTVTFAELEAAGLGSGFTASCVPKRPDTIRYLVFLHIRKEGTRKAGPA